MINQYVVLHEIGHGTHGRVRLGQDMSAEIQSGEDGAEVGVAEGSNAYYVSVVLSSP